MISAINPVSFKNAKYEAVTTLTEKGKKPLQLTIKAFSDAPRSYSLDVFVHDGDIVKGYYGSTYKGNTQKSIMEYLDNFEHETEKLDKLFKYDIKDKKEIRDNLDLFFAAIAK